MKVLGAMLVLACCIATANEGEKYNEVLNPGDAAPAWTELPGIDGKKHSLADLKDKEVVVVIFTCCSCPVAEDYEARIVAFAKKNAHGAGSKVGVVAINVNTIPEDRLPKMKERAEKKAFTFPFLYDESQKIARAYGARYTPEFFVLNKERKVVYMGALDDRNDPSNVKANYLQDAIDATLRGEKAAISETLGRGCLIRFNRVKQ